MWQGCTFGAEVSNDHRHFRARHLGGPCCAFAKNISFWLFEGWLLSLGLLLLYLYCCSYYLRHLLAPYKRRKGKSVPSLLGIKLLESCDSVYRAGRCLRLTATLHILASRGCFSMMRSGVGVKFMSFHSTTGLRNLEIATCRCPGNTLSTPSDCH